MNKFKTLLLMILSGILVLNFCSCKKNSELDNPEISTISVSSDRSAIYVGQKEQMRATVALSDGTVRSAAGMWSSDNTSIATVDQTGLVTGIANGTVTISCKEGNLTGQKTLTVQTPEITSVSVNSDRMIIYVSQKEQMIANVTFSDGTTKAMTGKWTTSNSTVATVTQTGLVTGMQNGSVNIFVDVTYNGSKMRGSKVIRVKEPWSKSGVGDSVFDMPSTVSRVHVIATYNRRSSNFIVDVNGRLFINELLGTAWGSTVYNGILRTSGGVVEITHSSGVSWVFKEVPVSAATTHRSRRIPEITDPSDSRIHEYEIYKSHENR